MDKENGKGHESSSGSSKISATPDPASLLDAANLFGAYWARGADANAAAAAAAANAANLFGGFGLPPHPSLPFGILPPPPPTSTGRGMGSSAAAAYPTSSSAAAAAYNNAYTNTLSVAASQAASLGIPAASAAWWSMASHLAAQDYLARLQASGLNFPSLASTGNPSDLQYASLGLQSLCSTSVASNSSSSSASSAAITASGHKSKSSTKSSSSSLPKNKDKTKTLSATSASSSLLSSPSNLSNHNSNRANNGSKYSVTNSLTIQPSGGSTSISNSTKYNERSDRKSSLSSSSSKATDLSYVKHLEKSNSRNSAVNSSSSNSSSTNSRSISGLTSEQQGSSNSLASFNNSNNIGNSVKVPPQLSPSIFSSPLSLISNSPSLDKISSGSSAVITTTTTTTTTTTSTSSASAMTNSFNSITSLPSSILSDPHSILGGVRLPPDTEIIKYTSSIVGPKIPGTTNRGRKKTISLDPPQDFDLTPPSTPGDRVEVIKLPTTNGSPISFAVNSMNTSGGSISDGGGADAPLNLSLKPSTSNATNSSSLNSLSNMSTSLSVDRISRRKPGPKPRRVIQSSPQLPPCNPSASLNELFASVAAATASSPRPSSRNEGSDDGSSTSSNRTTPAPPNINSNASTNLTSPSMSMHNHKEGRPRNLGRGVSKPKKNTVASLLAQSRALGIKPVPMLDPNATMNQQQMQLLKSNIMAAKQYISEAGGDERALNKFLQERFRGALSDSSTVDASTDSDNLTDSNHTDSELETEVVAAKKQKQYDERLLRVPLEKGWKRETIIKGLTKNGGIKGDVTYAAPDSANKFKQMSDVTQYLEYQKNTELSKENFTFSCRAIIGDYLQPVPPEMSIDGSDFIHLTEDDVTKRLEELKTAMRTSLPVEQRIEMARKQQAARAAARLDREQARLAKEIERTERQEAARRDREARSQQMLEAKRKRQEEMEKHRQEEQQRKQQEREMKRQQAAILKEQERERRRQHMALVKALENRRRLEERERKKQQLLAEKQANKEKKIEQRKMEMEILAEIRKPAEDLELEQKPLPEYERIKGLKLCGKAFGDIMMVFEFLHNFGETLGFDMESLPTLDSLQQALMPNEHSSEAEEELFSVMTHLLVCAIEDPGIPNPARHTTILGQSLRQADITHANLSEILRIYLYANATGEVKALTGVHFERDREKRVADHHQNDNEMQQTQVGKNAQYYELLHDNPTYKMSDLLKDKPFMALSPTDKAAILAFICNELLQNKAVIKQIEGSLESVAQIRKEKWLLDTKLRKVKMLHSRKVRAEAVEKASLSAKSEIDGNESNNVVDSPSNTLSTTKQDELLDEEENEMSENESIATQPEEEEDNKLSAEELGKKLEKLVKTSEQQLQSLNTSSLQLRAICYGQDRFWRRYWSLPKAGGIFVEAMESADPEEFSRHEELDVVYQNTLQALDENSEEKIKENPAADREICQIIREKDEKTELEDRKTPSRFNNSDDQDLKEQIDKTNEDNKENRNIFEKEKDADDSSEIKATDHSRIDDNKIINPESMKCNSKENDIKVEPMDIDEQINNKFKLSENEVENHSTEIKSEHNNVAPISEEQYKGNGNSELVNENSEANDKSLEQSDTCEPKSERIEPIGSKKFNLFERLGQCMERENKSEEDFKAEVKQEVKDELKNEILNELKSEIKCEGNVKIEKCEKDVVKDEKVEKSKKSEVTETETQTDNEVKWFSILSKEGVSCESVHLTAGNKWDNGVGACTRDNITELKIPVFPPPNSNSIQFHSSCDSPAPLQMTAEESIQLEHIKKHGMPKINCPRLVPLNKRFGWWRITCPDTLKKVIDHFHTRGARERELKRTLLATMQTMYEQPGKFFIEEGNKELTELVCEHIADVEETHGGAPKPDVKGSWNPAIAHRVDLFLLEQVEALEDKVASASMQVKGWKLPVREGPDPSPGEVVQLCKERLSSLEQNIERRYLKPPLGVNKRVCSTGDPNLAAIAQEAATATTATASSSGSATTTPSATVPSATAATSSSASVADDVPKGLIVWREAVNRSKTSAQLAMCLYSLESSIAWDKSIMKANCQFCHSGDNEDKLLLCDGCDKGYHTYCFKPKMDNIPDGDWYCYECMNKATGERNCIVCGKKQSATGTKLILCELCPRCYHTDCIQPIMAKAPRGKWYCSNCISKKPQKKTVRKNHNKVTRESESSDHPPSSPAPSHSSVTTNEDQTTSNLNQSSDVSNSSLPNAVISSNGSPSSNPVLQPQPQQQQKSDQTTPVQPPQQPAQQSQNVSKKERTNKKLLKELAPCKALLEDLECHDDAWPFLLPVNTKQFPTYKKIIKIPMDLSTIKKRLQDVYYKSKEEFCADVRQIFNNCETFNEDDSPVGKAGHCMRQFFEARWSEICSSHS